jgi:hypothetical protein
MKKNVLKDKSFKFAENSKPIITNKPDLTQIIMKRKTNKFLVLAMCFTFLSMSKLFCENETKNEIKNWNVALSNAIFASRIDNVQLEFERRIRPNINRPYTSIGLYAQSANYIADIENKFLAKDYLPLHGYMAKGTSWQAGFQITKHFLSPESEWNLWFKRRIGVNRTHRHNEAGTYWYWQNQEKEYYTIAEKQSNWFGNLEISIGIGLSYKISDNFFVFVEPALNCQFYAQNYRIPRVDDFRIEGFFVMRYGVSYSF